MPRIDVAGSAVLSAALAALLLALDEGIGAGFGSPAILALFAVAVGLLGCFAAVERRRGSDALVPASVAGNRVFVAATAGALTAGIAHAFRVDAALALVGLALVLAFVTDPPAPARAPAPA